MIQLDRSVSRAFLLFLALLPVATLSWVCVEARGLSFEHLSAMRQVGDVRISPDGTRIAYTLSVPRKPGEDDDGPAWSELHLVTADGGDDRPLVSGEVNVSGIRFSPDGRMVLFRAKRGDDEHTALWGIPVDGGEARKLLEFENDISAYRVAPDGKRIAFLSKEPEAEALKKAKKKGYKQEVFEEDWHPQKLWIAELAPYRPPFEDPSAEAAEAEDEDEDEQPQALEIDGSVFDVEWSPEGKRLALGVAPRPLIDDRYMKRRITIFDAGRGTKVGVLNNPGKLGSFKFSPDGRRIAMISAADPNDPRAGRLLVGDATGGEVRDPMPGFDAHVADFAWRDADSVLFVADVGTETMFGEIELSSGNRKAHLARRPNLPGSSPVPVLRTMSLSADGRSVAFGAETPSHPREVFVMAHGETNAKRLTRSNPWLDGVELATQETLRWRAGDGLELEGVLLRPLSPSEGPAPLLLMVHGGPEAHDRNGWVTSYSRPGQLAAARGYAVLYPNYRGSTGRGVAFSKMGQGDAAGKEFQDLVDAVDHLVQAGVADGDRVGINGGSYGGYATAWCATRYTERFRAGVMFVGISNKISKGLTTEIPVEDKMVHTLFDPWTRWQFSLERSPVYHAEQSRTALLIAGGTADTRVHPSQSLQLYRALKLIGKTPVRYVRYPGEGHGNRKAAARDDYTRRLLRWMDHFVLNGQTELPPWEADWAPGADGDEDDEEGAEE